MSNLTLTEKSSTGFQLLTLGAFPYVVVEFKPDESDEDDLQALITVGGGLTLADLREALTVAVELVDAAIDENPEAASRLSPKEKS